MSQFTRESSANTSVKALSTLDWEISQSRYVRLVNIRSGIKTPHSDNATIFECINLETNEPLHIWQSSGLKLKEPGKCYEIQFEGKKKNPTTKMTFASFGIYNIKDPEVAVEKETKVQGTKPITLNLDEDIDL